MTVLYGGDQPIIGTQHGRPIDSVPFMAAGHRWPLATHGTLGPDRGSTVPSYHVVVVVVVL
jgi:hypothetical protein